MTSSFLRWRHPDDRIERVIEEMRVDLRLKGTDLAVPFFLFVLHALCHEGIGVLHHAVESAAEMADFIVERGVGTYRQIALLHLVHRAFQLFDRPGNGGGDQRGHYGRQAKQH